MWQYEKNHQFEKKVTGEYKEISWCLDDPVMAQKFNRWVTNY